VCEQGSTAHADDQSELAAIENCTGQITMRPFTKEGEQTMATRRSKKKLTKKKPSKKQPRAATTALPAGVTSDDEDWEVKEARWRSILVNQAKRAIALRSLDREFHGLEREFRDHQAQMLIDYERTKDLKHPRDLGDTREQILRKFLSSSGYLPARYAVSDRSVRVVSTSGHMSREIDIALYDRLDAVTLMNREEVYQALPLENVYGVIQVKSRLTKATIKDGLENLASFKNLRAVRPQARFTIIQSPPKSDRGFGLLFAYDSDLSLSQVIAEVEAFAAEHGPREWANFVFVLNKGLVFHGEDNDVRFVNAGIEAIKALKMQGRPDREGYGLYNFYSLLMNLLRSTETRPPEVDAYFSLPLVADNLSYRFHMGMFREFGVCAQHGDYARKIEADQLAKVVAWCKTSQPINWVRAHLLAYGQPEDEAAYARQPGEVFIYNPEELPLSQILTGPASVGELATQALAYDAIESEGMHILIPWLYSFNEGIISECPECAKAAAKTTKGAPKG